MGKVEKTPKTDKDTTVPDLSNATPSFLIDEIGRMRVEAARLKFLDGVFKQALEARCSEKQLRGEKFIEGEKYLGDYVEKSSMRIDADKVREELKAEPDRLARCFSETRFKQLNTRPRINQV